MVPPEIVNTRCAHGVLRSGLRGKAAAGLILIHTGSGLRRGGKVDRETGCFVPSLRVEASNAAVLHSEMAL